MKLRSLFIGLFASVMMATAVWAETSLVMVEEKGCIWCARWNDQIAPIYPKTAVGKAAPLRRIDVNDDAPDDLTFARSLHFTPTFVLMVDGNEISRIEGYPGEDFFWGLLEKMMANADLFHPPGGS